MNYTILWIGFIAIVLPLLALDLGLFHRKAHVIRVREALIWSCVWVGLALVFAGGVFFFRGSVSGMEFLTGYVIEEALSVDNVFVFAMIFASLQIPAAYQHRVLFWGVVSAILLRGLMITLGITLIAQFHWIFYVFGGFLILTGIKTFLSRNASASPGEIWVLDWLKRHVPLTEQYHGQKFFTHQNGKAVATPLFLALLLVELMDLVFALDSIPAIFAVTRDPMIVFTSNVFAILGLRSLYFVLAGVMDRFHYLKVGLSAVLVFVGFKMLGLVSIPIGISLMVIVLLLALSIGASLLRMRQREK